MALDPISAAFDLGGKLIDHFWPNAADRDKAKLALFEMQQRGELQQIAGQIQVNTEEAKSQSVFVSGWRPFIGWVCGSGLAYQFIVRPLLTFAVVIWHPGFVSPTIETAQLIELLVGMLGLGAMRTFEKYNGTVMEGHK
jgi:hypothetical protein